MDLLDKVIKGTEVCLSGGLPQRCVECPYHHDGCDHKRMRDSLILLNDLKLRRSETAAISASGNGIAVGSVSGGLTIQRRRG